ncbi:MULTISPECIES: peptidoglycan-binding domain-containing protein [Micromonospora]|uniref:peptidoglycan-binding domain-containing protein n=1 Tax=Micromonospora TaxID=1873 RepID=UPI00098D31A7|nr:MULTISPECIES: peptidoglycan-binding domain-containing protein [unclassified Micromonospora]MDI5937642.1 peptidoglycan-binding domain-containing protein [Micromonospora sp. DH15]OON31513.1 hypothetical protein BSA16_10650 [Micromonospora sp. Rc5]
MTNWKQRAAFTMAAALVGAAAFAAPAEANTSEGYVAGGGVVTDDFGDEGTVSQSSHRYSGATGLWQLILWADGAKESDGTNYDYADIDCDFGPNTVAATKNWQQRYGLTADGVVGTATFGRADANLSQISDLGDQIEVRYNGSVNSFTMYRNDSSGSMPNAYSVGFSYFRYDSAPSPCF